MQQSHPTTPPESDDESDQSETIDRADAISRCRQALAGTPGLGGLDKAVRSCVDDLVGTPLARVDSVLNGTVNNLLNNPGGGSSDGQSGGLLCGIFGTCRDNA